MTSPVPRYAAWHEHAQEIDNPERGVHLTITEVCERTGVKAVTVMHAMNRAEEYSGLQPMHHLMRPAFRVNGSEPRWSNEQVRAYYDAVTTATAGMQAKYGHLPVITEDEARERQLVNLRTIARLSGFALTTLHRWSGLVDFPPLVARVGSLGPQPRLLRSWPDVREFLVNRRPDTALPETLAAEDYETSAIPAQDHDDDVVDR